MKRPKLVLVVAVTVALACLDDASRPPLKPNATITDAVHGTGGNAFFRWLPPIVPAGPIAGQFTPRAEPVVQVCEVEVDSCTNVVATFTTSTGLGSEVIQVQNDKYMVNWHTDLSNLQADKMYRLRVLLDGVELGFADVDVGRNAGELRSVNRDEFIALVNGRTLPVQFWIGVGAACVAGVTDCQRQTVPPEGGPVVVHDGSGRALAFAVFRDGWTDAPAEVIIERINDAGFAPGEGPLGTDFPQYPLFFDFFTAAPEPFNQLVDIGVCQVDNRIEGEEPYHGFDRSALVLAMGGTRSAFRVLDPPREPGIVNELLQSCDGVRRRVRGDGDDVGGRVRALGATLRTLAARLLLPSPLHANALVVVDGGMGGSTDAFTPAGAVDTGTSAEPPPAGELAFARRFPDGELGNFEILRINVDGTGEVNITNNAAWDTDPVWSPDGAKIAFQSRRADIGDVWAMNADGSSPVNLTNNPDAFEISPSWSRDGTKIAYMNRTPFDQTFVMNADGSDNTFVAGTSAANAGFPSWSPDGTKIAFATQRDGNSEIYVMNADGSNPVNLTRHPGFDLDPRWSPDGTKIAFFTSRDGNGEIYIMNADGSNPVNLTQNAALDRVGGWSPDSRFFTFSTDRDGNDEIYIVSLDRTFLRRVTVNAAEDLSPAWRP